MWELGFFTPKYEKTLCKNSSGILWAQLMPAYRDIAHFGVWRSLIFSKKFLELGFSMLEKKNLVSIKVTKIWEKTKKISAKFKLISWQLFTKSIHAKIWIKNRKLFRSWFFMSWKDNSTSSRFERNYRFYVCYFSAASTNVTK